MNEATASKVNNLDLTAGVGLDEDVFRLEIAVDQLEFVDKGQCIQDLLRDLLQTRHIKVELLLHLTIVLGVLVKVVTQEFGHNEEMLFVIEEVDQLKEVLLVEILAVRIYVT